SAGLHVPPHEVVHLCRLGASALRPRAVPRARARARPLVPADLHLLMTFEMTDAAGDPALATLLRSRLGRRHPVAAVATVAGGEMLLAAIGTGLDSRYEIGSISKWVTGLIYVDALERG